jgi:hypothetical protein
LSIRFQADDNLKWIIVDATLRREPRIDFQTAQAARLDDLDDETVLRLAASQSRFCSKIPELLLPFPERALLPYIGKPQGLHSTCNVCR